MPERLVLVGGGGHCGSVVESLRGDPRFRIEGILDLPGQVGRTVSGVPVIGVDDDLLELHARGVRYAFVSLGSIGAPVARIRLFRRLEALGFEMPTVIDPSASVSTSARLGRGTYIGRLAAVNADVEVGEGAIVNTSAVVEHGCSVGRFAHISSGCVLCGGVVVGENTHVGAGAVVRQGIRIGRDAMVGIGSVVVRDVADGATAYGNPCREVRLP